MAAVKDISVDAAPAPATGWHFHIARITTALKAFSLNNISALLPSLANNVKATGRFLCS